MTAMEEWPTERIDALEHTFIGPTWAYGEDGLLALPEHSLGWEIADWCEDNLCLPDGEVDENGETPPWTFTDEQLRFVLWWYALDDAGRFTYTSGVLQRLKGWGKDPLLAVLCLVELIGPCRFSHWEYDGEDKFPVGKSLSNALVQVAAVNLEQSSNTTALFRTLIPKRTELKYSLELQNENVWAHGRRQRLMAVTSNPRSLEGKRSTFVCLNETHVWVAGNNGHAMYEVIHGNATKVLGRTLAITNAYMPGEDSVGERMRNAYERLVESGLPHQTLYDSVEAAAETPLIPHVLEKVLQIVRGDAVWLDIPNIVNGIVTSGINAARNRRMWLNQIVSSDDALIPVAVWDALTDTRLHGNELELANGDYVTLGFDGGKTDDSTALVAMRVRDGLTQIIGLWENPKDGTDWRVNVDAVDAAVHAAMKRFRVVAFFADVALWEQKIEDWHVAYGEDMAVKASGENAIAWDMRRSHLSTLAHQRLLDAIDNKRITHQGKRNTLAMALHRHVMNVRRRDNTHGVGFGKESRESPKKIDAYAAMMLAHEGRSRYMTRKKDTPKKGGRVYSMARAIQGAP